MKRQRRDYAAAFPTGGSVAHHQGLYLRNIGNENLDILFRSRTRREHLLAHDLLAIFALRANREGTLFDAYGGAKDAPAPGGPPVSERYPDRVSPGRRGREHCHLVTIPDLE
jgi:hypothetical protein